MAKRQTVLIRCSGHDCHELIPASKGLYCKTCLAADRPHKCLNPECSTIVYGQTQRCKPCNKVYRTRNDLEAKRKARREELEFIAAVVAKPVQRKKPQTEEEINKRAAKIEREFAKAERELNSRRDNLNQTLLAARILRGAVCNYVGG